MAFTGASVAIAKPLAAVMPVFLLGLLRCVIAAAALAPFAFKDFRASLAGASVARGALIGQTITGVFLFTSFLFFGVRYSSALSAGIITATMPAAVAVLSYFWLKERLTRAGAFAVGLAILGVAFTNAAGGDGADMSGGGPDVALARTLLGTGLLVLAVFSEAAYTIYAKQTAQHLGAIPIAFFVNLLGALLFLVPGVTQGLSFDWALADRSVWILIFCFAIGSSVFALVFWYIGVREVKANVAGLFTAVMPVSAGLIAVFFLGENASPAQLAGGLLVVAAIVTGSRGIR